MYINVREQRRGNTKFTIQHWVHKTQDKDKQNKKYTMYVVAILTVHQELSNNNNQSINDGTFW
jgi:hypothetical protein